MSAASNEQEPGSDLDEPMGSQGQVRDRCLECHNLGVLTVNVLCQPTKSVSY